MPTYEYRCARGHSFDVFQKMSDEPVGSCPDCGAEAMRVLSGGGGFLLKGEGFYITDYRSEEYRKKAEAEKGAAPGVETKKQPQATPAPKGAAKGADDAPKKAPASDAPAGGGSGGSESGGGSPSSGDD